MKSLLFTDSFICSRCAISAPFSAPSIAIKEALRRETSAVQGQRSVEIELCRYTAAIPSAATVVFEPNPL
jgi:hypothetical protein